MEGDKNGPDDTVCLLRVFEDRSCPNVEVVEVIGGDEFVALTARQPAPAILALACCQACSGVDTLRI